MLDPYPPTFVMFWPQRSLLTIAYMSLKQDKHVPQHTSSNQKISLWSDQGMSHRPPARPSVNQTSGLLCSFGLGPGLEPGTGSGEMGSSVELQTKRRTKDWLSLRASSPFRLTLNPTLKTQLDWRFNVKRVEFKLRGLTNSSQKWQERQWALKCSWGTMPVLLIVPKFCQKFVSETTTATNSV